MGKYAVIVGINYIKDPQAALSGCCNDARMMKEVVQRKGFHDRNIRLLVDDDDSVADPSGREVKRALTWLVSNRRPGDVLFFHFSGHGTQIPDGSGDESDRKDEAICLESMFLMVDDDLKDYFQQIPEGVCVTVIMDCCHSGSMLDGDQIAIDGDKDGDSEANEEVSDSLLAILDGTRGEHIPRELPIEIVMSILSGHAGHEVEIGGIHGALAELFGSNSGKLGMVASALFQALDIYEFSEEEDEPSDSEDEYGYEDEIGDEDVAVLITGCQSHETSADVRTNDGDAFGALTKTLSTVVAAESGISYYDLVSKVRAHLADKGFSQNPCLECDPSVADRRFIC